uniref:DUF7159 domain-containing protein n=1 Tax=Mycolicibacterium gilvum (strain PYR-GCK) TaxID=350054 RepID=A4TA38_MYCGI|nr:conserved hypothetical protein [Mycolicibacterium gilvum PYR-GCK]
MRVVLGLSVTAGSAVWVLVDTYDGSIIADEVVALDSTHEIARAAARSVQDYATQSSRDIDGVRLVWDDEARHEGIRLRTKLRLFGFEVIETVSEEAAREGRNRTARHIAPHMVLAYGAARADLDDASDKGVLRRLTEKVPARDLADRGAGAPALTDRFASARIAGSEAAMRASDRWRDISSRVPGGTVARVAAGFFAVAVTGVVGYALLGSSTSHEVPQPAVAEAVVPPPPVAVQPAPVTMPPAAVVADAPAPAAVPEVASVPEYLPEPEYTAVPEMATEVTTDVATEVATATAAEATDVPATTATPDLIGTAQTVGTGTAELPAATGEPHLTGLGPAAGPAPLAQATPSAVGTPAPPAPAGPVGALLGALP